MIFAQWRARRASKALIEQILGEIVAAARRPALYEALGAPDRSTADSSSWRCMPGWSCAASRRWAAWPIPSPRISSTASSPISTTRCARWDCRISPVEAPELDGKRLLRPQRRLCRRPRRGSRRNCCGAGAQCVRGRRPERRGEGGRARLLCQVCSTPRYRRSPIEAFATGRFRFPEGSITAGGPHA